MTRGSACTRSLWSIQAIGWVKSVIRVKRVGKVRTTLLLLTLLCTAAGPPGADSCTGCHLPGAGLAPLQGRPAADIAAALDAYRDGSRPGTLMPRIVRGFSPAELHALAIWFAKQ